jgi:hypothetical protein
MRRGQDEQRQADPRPPLEERLQLLVRVVSIVKKIRVGVMEQRSHLREHLGGPVAALPLLILLLVAALKQAGHELTAKGGGCANAGVAAGTQFVGSAIKAASLAPTMPRNCRRR